LWDAANVFISGNVCLLTSVLQKKKAKNRFFKCKQIRNRAIIKHQGSGRKDIIKVRTKLLKFITNGKTKSQFFEKNLSLKHE